METEMAAVEASFRKKTGLSTREFRGGRRDTAERDADRAAMGPPSAITADAASDTAPAPCRSTATTGG